MMPRHATTITPSSPIITAVVGFGAAIALAMLTALLAHPAALNSDFMAFWSFPRFAAGHPIRQIYDAAALQAFQKSLYPGFGSFYPYLYPPTFLLPSWWLSFFAFGPAFLFWTAVGLLLFSTATLALFPRHRWIVLLALLASPASLLNGVTGETAYFTSALLFLGFAALPARPVLAGIAFGLLTLKPQLGVLLPVLLLARGDWAAILAATLTAATLIALSCLAFPPGLWLLWAHTLPTYQAQYFSGPGLNLNILVTPAANLVTLGVRPAIAWIAQCLCAAIIALLVFLTARRAPYRLTVAALLAGSFLAVPHAYAYDTITLPAAMALGLTARTPLWLVLLGCFLYLAPLALLSPAYSYFLYAIPEALLFVAIVLLALDKPNSAIIAHEPNPLPATQP
jgi:Glycosyltransferase family 87